MSGKRNTKKGSSKNDSNDNRFLQNHHPTLSEQHELQNSTRHNAAPKRSSDNTIHHNVSRHINISDSTQGNSWRKKVPEESEQHSGTVEHSRHELAYNQGKPEDSPLTWHSQRFHSVIKNTRAHRDNNFSGQTMNNGPTYYESYSQHQQKHNYNSNSFTSMCDKAFLKLAQQRNQASSVTSHPQDLNGTHTTLLSSQPYTANYATSASFETNQVTSQAFITQPTPSYNTNVHENHSSQFIQGQSKHLSASGQFHKPDYTMNIQPMQTSNFPSPKITGESNEAHSSPQYTHTSSPQQFNNIQHNNTLSTNQSSELHHSIHTNNQTHNNSTYGNQQHNKQITNSHHYGPTSRNNSEVSSQGNKSSIHLSSNPNSSRHSEIYHESQSDEHILSTPSEPFNSINMHQMNRSYSYTNNSSKQTKNSQTRI